MSTSKEEILYGPRRSGRTTRMLKVVADNLYVGKKVVVIVASISHVRGMTDTLRELLVPRCTKTNFSDLALETAHRLVVEGVTFASMSDSRWSIFRPSYFEGRSDDLVFVDHYVVQSVIEQLQVLLHRWDK